MEKSSYTYEQLLIITEQMKRCVCQIILKDIKGTGFFCKFSVPNKNIYVRALITNNHIINQNVLQEGISINIGIDNNREKRIINIKNDRKVYTNRESDITIIEINEKDGITNFLELDEYINNPFILNKSNIYFLYYLGNEYKGRVSFGILRNIEENGNRIFHDCSSDMGSAGGPLLSSQTHKVIGIHIGFMRNRNLNIGSLLNQAVSEFLNNYLK